MRIALRFLGSLLPLCSGLSFAAGCSGSGLEVQVLGSGGPETQAKRASSSYLVWRDGSARVPEGAEGVERFLHMPPSVIGRIAATASVKRLLLSHRMRRTLGREPETLKAVSEQYAGPVSFAEDLDCLKLTPHP